jgi:hypothetical protein
MTVDVPLTFIAYIPRFLARLLERVGGILNGKKTFNGLHSKWLPLLRIRMRAKTIGSTNVEMQYARRKTNP